MADASIASANISTCFWPDITKFFVMLKVAIKTPPLSVWLFLHFEYFPTYIIRFYNSFIRYSSLKKATPIPNITNTVPTAIIC